jgi:hypothetical protein
MISWTPSIPLFQKRIALHMRLGLPSPSQRYALGPFLSRKRERDFEAASRARETIGRSAYFRFFPDPFY